MLFGGFLVFVLCVSLGVEQATKGEYATPKLIGEILKIAIPAFFTAGGLSEVMRHLNRRNQVQPEDGLDLDPRNQGRRREIEPDAGQSE